VKLPRPERLTGDYRKDTAVTDQQAVVVTTAHRGVFFGHLADRGDRYVKTLTLTDAQMCVHWSADVQGVLGLAATGPTQGCKVTRPVPRITLQDVTAVLDATPEAVKLWQDRPWS
jgi:hypothetical protein